MKRSSIVWIVAAAVVIIAGGIWYWSWATPTAGVQSTNTPSSTASAGTTPTNNPPTAAPKQSTTSIIVLDTEATGTLGTYLAATNGMTLYLSKADKAGVSNCTGACAIAWPPYTVPATTAASLVGSTSGITGKVGLIKRANGTFQVTYNNLPLYFYANDRFVGDAKGQDVGGFVIVNL